MWQTKWGRCIHTSPSGYKIYQNFFYRWLTLGSSALQTVINRRKPEKPILYYIPALSLMARQNSEKVCLLGLGGAGMAHLLAAKNPEQWIVAVDSSKEIIQLARQFFMTDQLINLNITHQNAVDFLETSTEQFPHLLVDLYDANHFPTECANEQFFVNCKRRLAENGFLAVNLANLKEQWPIFNLIKTQFKNTLVIPVKNSANMVIIACKHEHLDFFLSHINKTGEIKKIMWVNDWGYVAEYSNYMMIN